MATDKPRFSLTLDEALLAQVENYQKKNGYSTKSRAIQSLLEIGLDDLLQNMALPEKEKSPSLEDGDAEMLMLYHQLDAIDRERIKERMETFLENEKYQKEPLSKNA